MQQNVNQTGSEVQGDEDFAAMFEASMKERGGEGLLKEGDIVKGTIVQVTKDYAVVDIGYKSEGQVPIQEFGLLEGKPNVKVGDAVEVLLEQHGTDRLLAALVGGQGRRPRKSRTYERRLFVEPVQSARRQFVNGLLAECLGNNSVQKVGGIYGPI